MTLLIYLCVAMVYDLCTFKIPNKFIIIGWAIGLIYRCFLPEGKLLIYYLISACMLIFLLLPLYKLHAIGGGDVKLLSVCGMFEGIKAGISISFYSLFAGAILSILYLVYHQFFSKQKKERHVIHFSIAIVIGMLTEHALGGVLWEMF